MKPLARKLAATFVISVAGLATLVTEEGSRNSAYLDIANIPTICVGHTANVRMGDTATNEVCHELLKQDVRIAESAIRGSVRVAITQDQFDALVSWTFNVGAKAAAGSTLVRKLNAGDCRGAASEFPRWVHAGGKKSAGLLKRRLREQKHFEKDCP
jgi:lysozyme